MDGMFLSCHWFVCLLVWLVVCNQSVIFVAETTRRTGRRSRTSIHTYMHTYRGEYIHECFETVSDMPLPPEKHPQPLHHLPEPAVAVVVVVDSIIIIPDDDPPPDPRRQLALDPRRPVPPVQQEDARVVASMPDGPPDALVHRPHARVLVQLPPRRFPFVSAAAALLDVLELGFPGGAPGVGEGEADDGDAAAEGVGEVDAFGQFAADDGEEEAAAAAAGGDGLGVSVQDVVRARGGF